MGNMYLIVCFAPLCSPLRRTAAMGTVELGCATVGLEMPDDHWDDCDEEGADCDRWTRMYMRVPEGSRPDCVACTPGGRHMWVLRQDIVKAKQGKLWMATMHFPGNSMPRAKDKQALDQFLEEHTDKFAYQLERGKLGGLHYQIAFRTKKIHRWAECYGRLLMYGLWNVRAILSDTKKYGRRDLFTYCIKADTRVEGPWHKGLSADQQGKRNDIVVFKDAIKAGATNAQLIDDHTGAWMRYMRCVEPVRNAFAPSNTPKRRVEYRYGQSGCGKTSSILTEYGVDSVFFIAVPASNGVLWCDGYRPAVHRVVVIDEFAPPWIKMAVLLRLLQPIPMMVQVKGDSLRFRPEVLIITANKKWDELYTTHWQTHPEHIMAFHRRIGDPKENAEVRFYERKADWKDGDPPVFSVLKEDQFSDDKYVKGLPNLVMRLPLAPYQPNAYMPSEDNY